VSWGNCGKAEFYVTGFRAAHQQQLEILFRSCFVFSRDNQLLRHFLEKSFFAIL
jgi:hypothetical protein